MTPILPSSPRITHGVCKAGTRFLAVADCLAPRRPVDTLRDTPRIGVEV